MFFLGCKIIIKKGAQFFISFKVANYLSNDLPSLLK